MVFGCFWVVLLEILLKDKRMSIIVNFICHITEKISVSCFVYLVFFYECSVDTSCKLLSTYLFSLSSSTVDEIHRRIWAQNSKGSWGIFEWWLLCHSRWERPLPVFFMAIWSEAMLKLRWWWKAGYVLLHSDKFFSLDSWKEIKDGLVYDVEDIFTKTYQHHFCVKVIEHEHEWCGKQHHLGSLEISEGRICLQILVKV